MAEGSFLDAYCRTVTELELAVGTNGGEVMMRLWRSTEIEDFGPGVISHQFTIL